MGKLKFLTELLQIIIKLENEALSLLTGFLGKTQENLNKHMTTFNVKLLSGHRKQ